MLITPALSFNGDANKTSFVLHESFLNAVKVIMCTTVNLNGKIKHHLIEDMINKLGSYV